MSRNGTGQKAAPPQEVIGAKAELQERWKRLNLKPATLLHLQEILDTSGVVAATIVTEAVVQQKEKPVTFAGVGKEWGAEALRLLSLEGVRPHLIDVLRVVLETFIAWHFISLPAGALDNAVEIILALLFLLVSLLGICVARQFRRTLLASKKRKNSW